MNFTKLAKFKKNNPDYLCIYAAINANTKDKTLKGSINTIIHDDVEIKYYVGYKFLNLIFEENTNIIIEFVKKIIDKYL
jgi:hypothetical protein